MDRSTSTKASQMSKIIISIETDNAAFDSPGESARILRKIATDLEHYDPRSQFEKTTLKLLDYNGNACGFVVVTNDNEDSPGGD